MEPEITIADPQGKWYRWTGAFPYNDPDSNITFQPGVATKATPTEALKRQSCMVEIADPTAESKKQKSSKE